MKLEPITMRFLPPDEHKPEGLPPDIKALLLAFEVERGDTRFSAAWAVGKGDKVSNVGQAAMLRACSASKRMSGDKKFNVRLAQVSNQKRGTHKTWRYVRAHLAVAPPLDAMIFICADDRLYDQAAWGIFRDLTVTVYDNEGTLIPRLNQEPGLSW